MTGILVSGMLLVTVNSLTVSTVDKGKVKENPELVAEEQGARRRSISTDYCIATCSISSPLT